MNLVDVCFYHKYFHGTPNHPNALICLYNSAAWNTVTAFLLWKLLIESPLPTDFYFLENTVIMWTIWCCLITHGFFLSRNIHTSKDPEHQMWCIYFCDLIVYDSQVKQKLFCESTLVSQSLSMNAPVDICCK